jgi:hypothetical protein
MANWSGTLHMIFGSYDTSVGHERTEAARRDRRGPELVAGPLGDPVTSARWVNRMSPLSPWLVPKRWERNQHVSSKRWYTARSAATPCR